MAIFRYTYLTKDGKKKSGVISSDNEKNAVKNIPGKLISIRKNYNFLSTVKNADLIQFFTYIFFQIKNKISIFEAISSYCDVVDNVAMQAIVASMRQKMLNGESLFDVFSSENVFGQVIPSLLQSAENTGNLEDSLQSIITFLKFQEKIRTKIRKAAMYPIIVLFMSVLAFFFCLTCLGPQVQDVIKETGTSSFLTDLCLWLIPDENFCIGFMMFFTIIPLFFKRKFLIHFMYIIPNFKEIIRKFYEWNCCTIMYISISSQTTLTKTINLLINSLNKTIFDGIFKNILDEISSGARLSQALSKNDFFAKKTILMIKIGEENNELERSFQNIIEMQNEEIMLEINRLGTKISAIITITTGILLTIILLGLYYPLYSSIEVIEM